MKNSNTSKRLKQLMTDRNLKQVDILNLCLPFCKKYSVKMNKSDISQYVSGKVEPNQDKLFVLGNALNVSEAWLMGYDVPMERDPLMEERKRRLKAYAEQWNIQFFEKKILDSFSQLNDSNKKKCISYTENLLSNQKLEDELLANAAHGRTSMEFTEEDRQNDEDMLD